MSDFTKALTIVKQVKPTVERKAFHNAPKCMSHVQANGKLYVNKSKKRKHKQQFVMAAILKAMDIQISDNWRMVAVDERQLKRAKRAAIHNAKVAGIVFTI